MSTCVVCTKQAFHCEESNPTLKFCDSKCQFLHYALIGAGKREREEEAVPEQGVDFTEILDSDSIMAIIEKFDTFDDMIALCQVNRNMLMLCVDKRFKRIYLGTQAGKRRFEDHVLRLKTMSKRNIDYLLGWVIVYEENNSPFSKGTWLSIACKYDNIPMLNYVISKYGLIDEDEHPKYGELAMSYGSLKIYKEMESVFDFQNSSFRFSIIPALGSQSIEMLEYVLSKSYVNSNVKASDIVHLAKLMNAPVLKVFIDHNGFDWNVDFWRSLLSGQANVAHMDQFLKAMVTNILHLLFAIKYNMSFHYRYIRDLVIYLGNRIRGKYITRMLKRIDNIHFLTEDDFIMLITHPNMTMDDKIKVFSHYKYKPDQYPRLKWMVENAGVDPSFDENMLYYSTGSYELREFLLTFPQVGSKLQMRIY